MNKTLLHSYSDSKSTEKIMLLYPNYSTFDEGIRFFKNGERVSVDDNSIEEVDGGSIQNDIHNSQEHCHTIMSGNQDNNGARRKLIIASVLCLFFMVAEIVGGTLAHSLAIMTDAAHLLSDFASFLISLFALYLASRPATKRMSFGWHRAEVVGALVSVLLIWVVTAILVYLAVMRVISKDFEINAKIMLITSGVGVIVNVIMACSLHTHSHSHSHSNANTEPPMDNDNSYDEENVMISPTTSQGDSVKTEIRVVDKSNSDRQRRKQNATNINVRAAFIHVIGDLLQSIGVLVAAFIIYFKPELKLADPICTFVFSLLVLCTTVHILRDAINVLMEGAPKSLDFDEVRDSLLHLDGVCLLHNLRIWSLTMDKTALSVHLAIDENRDLQKVLKEATKLLINKFQIADATIQVEHYVAKMDDCVKCQGPEK